MYTPIIGTLGYILSPDATQTLLVHRVGRDDDHHIGKYNGLGGKMKEREDIATCMHREIYEESGIVCTKMQLRGSINWPNFGPRGENWLGFIFLITEFSGHPCPANKEGTLAWHALDKIHTLPMWPGDRHFLPLVFDKDPRPFHGIMPYRDGQPVSWTFQRL